MNITEVLIQPQAIAWLPWAVQYFFYIGSAYAAAILFLIALIFEGHTSHRLRAALALTLAIGAIVGPLALTADLHQPGRAWHFYPYLTPWSWMSLGALFLPLFSSLAVVTAWLYLRNDLLQLEHQAGKMGTLISKLALGHWQVSQGWMRLIATLTVISGLSIALYTGAEIAAVQSRPLWHQPASPMLWFVTAFLGAVGFSLLILQFIPSRKNQLTYTDKRIIKHTTVSAALLATTLLPIWASNNASFSLYDDSQWLIWLAVMASSLLMSLFAALKGTNQGWLNRLALIFITLISAWLVRWVTLMEVQTIARFDVGPFPYELPLGSNGYLGIIGMFGLWLALALLASELIQPQRQTAPPAATQL